MSAPSETPIKTTRGDLIDFAEAIPGVPHPLHHDFVDELRNNGRRGLATEEELKEFEEIVCEHMYDEE